MKWLSLLVLFDGLGLLACTPVYKTVYELDPPSSAAGLQCVSQCQQLKSACRQSGRTAYELCRAEARAEAERRFADYRVARIEQGKKVKKSIRDFDRSYRCTRGANDKICESDFRGCFTSCGGTVTPYSYCTAFCDQEQ